MGFPRKKKACALFWTWSFILSSNDRGLTPHPQLNDCDIVVSFLWFPHRLDLPKTSAPLPSSATSTSLPGLDRFHSLKVTSEGFTQPCCLLESMTIPFQGLCLPPLHRRAQIFFPKSWGSDKRAQHPCQPWGDLWAHGRQPDTHDELVLGKRVLKHHGEKQRHLSRKMLSNSE